MKRVFLSYFTILMTLLVVTSCGSVMYMSPMASAPLLDDKGDVSADIKVELPSLIIPPAIEADASFAITDHFGFQFMGQMVEKENRYAQVGAGYFTKVVGHQVFESFITAGSGLQINYPDNPNSTSTLADKDYTRFSYKQYCIQADYGWKNMTKAHMDFGLSMRGGIMNYSLLGTTDDVEKVNIRRNIPLLEPMAFFRIGGEMVKFQIEVSYSTFSNHIDNAEVPRMIESPFCYTMGLNFNF